MKTDFVVLSEANCGVLFTVLVTLEVFNFIYLLNTT